MQLNKHRAAVFTTVQLLCEARTDIDKEFNNGATPLLVASQHGHAEVAQLLCGARTDIDEPFNDVATPLLMASQEGHAGIAQFLCEARADIDKPDNNAGTPLLMASQHGHAELAQLLCGARADIDKPDENCATALAWASRFGYTKVAQKRNGDNLLKSLTTWLGEREMMSLLAKGQSTLTPNTMSSTTSSVCQDVPQAEPAQKKARVERTSLLKPV